MAFQYYQQNVPGWGTSQLNFGPPPALGYAPLNTWNGLDYYRAHVMARGATFDPAFYQNVVNRTPIGGSVGLSLYEAEHWHRHAYGGLGELMRMLPVEIGAAAAYEAWRQFRYNMSQYDFLGPSGPRREALFGLAIAEGKPTYHLIQMYIHRHSWASASAEAAAATITTILSQTMGPGAGIADGLGGSDYYRGFGPSMTRPYDDNDVYLRGRALTRSPFPGRTYSRSPLPPGMLGRSPIPGTAYPPTYGGAGVGAGAGVGMLPAAGISAAGSGAAPGLGAGAMGIARGMGAMGTAAAPSVGAGVGAAASSGVGAGATMGGSSIPAAVPQAQGITGNTMPYGAAGSSLGGGALPYGAGNQIISYPAVPTATTQYAPGYTASYGMQAAGYNPAAAASYAQQPAIIVQGGHRHRHHRRHSHLGHRHHHRHHHYGYGYAY
ncbi:hypothetical protein K488DRAFT_82630 [Vararia minispora EC-137]|uniref:Uncharacterized protein n=1 Tax=Vararia minispora EC-137 TaxID=1314806 RepID=A0ACB8QW67_9AGAM|nr:hypothetical protein K488DRAFT_82630 [Vararia minispora EC-137]